MFGLGGFLWLVLFSLVAFLYSAVGHGGASGYLALLSLHDISPELMKPIALVLNLLVSGVAFFQFYRQRHFLWRLFLPIAIFSVPMAYWGGLTPLKEIWYQRGLGVFLVVSVLVMIWPRRKEIPFLSPSGVANPGDSGDSGSGVFDFKENHRGWRNKETGIAAFMGAVIGYISGLLGIGGGILLSPVLLMIGWTQQKQTAAISAAFIFVNSAAGLFGFVKQHPFNSSWSVVGILLSYLILPVILGGLLGSRYGAKKFNQTVMKYILCTVLLIAAIKLLL